MDNLTKSIVDGISEACQGQLRTRDLALYVGRAVAWQRLSEKLPPELIAPEKWTGIGGGALRSIWNAIASCESLRELRYAFIDRYPFPYERLSEEMIFRTQTSVLATLLLDHNQRTELAGWVVDTVQADEANVLIGLPSEIASFLIALLYAEPGSEVLCPEPNNEIVSIAVMKAGCMPIVVGNSQPVLSCLFACITGDSLRFLATDPYQIDLFNYATPINRHFGVIVPPFGQRADIRKSIPNRPSDFGARSTDVLGVELALRCIDDKAVVVVPNSLLFKGGAERRLREHLVGKGLLEAIVSFPSGLLANTNLPFSVLVIGAKQRKTSRVRFCRVSEHAHVSGQGKLRAHDRRFTGSQAILTALKSKDSKICISVTAKDIQLQEFALVPDRFFDKPGGILERRNDETMPLGEIVTIVKPQLLSEIREEDGVAIQEVSPGEMPSFGYLEQSPRTRYVDAKMLRVRQNQVVLANDILLSTKGTIGRVALCRPAQRTLPLLPSLSSVIIRLHPSLSPLDPRFLVMYLRSPAVQHVLNAMAVGATIRNISLGDLRNLAIWVPPLAQQTKLIEMFDRQMELEKQVNEIVREQQSISEQLWRELGLDHENKEAA